MRYCRLVLCLTQELFLEKLNENDREVKMVVLLLCFLFMIINIIYNKLLFKYNKEQNLNWQLLRFPQIIFFTIRNCTMIGINITV